MTTPAAAPPQPVAFVSSHATLGGAEAYLATIMDELGSAWVAGVVVLQDGPYVEQLRAAGRRVTVISTSASAWSMARAAWRLRRWLAKTPGRAVHANGLKAAAVAVAATAGTRRAVMWMKHDLAGGRVLDGVVGMRCRVIIAVSEAVRATFGARLRRRVHVVHNGIRPIRVDRSAARATVRELAGDGEVVVLAGRLCPGKGQMELLAAAPIVRERFPDARLLLVGGGDPAYPDHRQVLERRARALGLEDVLRFAGQRDDAVDLIAGADVLVAPSVRDPVHGWSEGFGLAAVEALAVGTPVVAYANGSLPEVLGDAAVIVDEGDRAALAAGIATVLGDPGRRAEMVRRGRRRVEERFSLNASMARLAQHYVAAGAR